VIGLGVLEDVLEMGEMGWRIFEGDAIDIEGVEKHREEGRKDEEAPGLPGSGTIPGKEGALSGFGRRFGGHGIPLKSAVPEQYTSPVP
jgi:hypothetical protein